MLPSLIVRSISRITTGTSSLSSKCISSSSEKAVIRAWMSTKSSDGDNNNNNNDSRMVLPWLMIDTTGNGKKGYKFYSPAENKVIMKSAVEDEDVGLVGCSEGWLVMHNKRSHDLFLYNPVSARRIPLPSFVSVPDKVVISSDMDMAMMCVKDTMAFCLPGRSALWTELNLKPQAAWYKDFVYSSKHKLLLCETRLGKKIESWDVSKPRSPRIVWQASCQKQIGGYYDEPYEIVWKSSLDELGGYYNHPPGEIVWESSHQEYYNPDECNTVRYLVLAEQCGELFLVKRHMSQQGAITIGFDVFAVDIACGKMRYVDGSFNGLSIFVGAKNDNCFALPAAAPEPDSIYFTDKKHPSCIGIYNYQSGAISYYPWCDDDAHFSKNSTSTWPLPAVWFTPTSSSKTCTPAAVSSNPSTTTTTTTTPWVFLPPFTRDEVYQFSSSLPADNNNNKVVEMVKKKRGKQVVEEESFIPVECSTCVDFLGSSHGWLALKDFLSNKLYLSNPISRHHIKLPSISGIPQKLVISGSPDDEQEGAVSAMVLNFSKVYAMVPGRSTKWTPLPCVDTKPNEYKGLVYSSRHRLFFCLGYAGRIESWDLTDTASPRIEWSANLQDMGLRRNSWSMIIESEQGLEQYSNEYLVFDDHSNQLFLIVQHIRRSIDPANKHEGKAAGFDVYKIDDWEGGGGRLIYMDGSLNGLSLFIGDNNDFALSAADFPGLKPDSIYYSTGRNDFGIFNYQDATFSPSNDFQFGPSDPSPLRITPPSLPSN